jgi:hypothetical protein
MNRCNPLCVIALRVSNGATIGQDVEDVEQQITLEIRAQTFLIPDELLALLSLKIACSIFIINPKTNCSKARL